ncbi:MAG: hypothetical protein A2104_09290 [Candidatus Melainabacteria bacterium GWF2_32_7]|nr:MAG: hypothetical protein A2104_09290 [Candidatus Melainabacteria bacterium GWF2_32_7]
MKKGKYQVEMTSDDVYFANRQVDRLFEKLLSTRGKLRVVLPSIDAEKVEKETRELEQQRLIKEITPNRIIVEEKKEEPPKVVKEIKEVAKKTDEIIETPSVETLPEKIEELIEEQEEIKTVSEKIEEPVELVEEIEKEESEILVEEEEDVAEIVEEVIEEQKQGNLFENILAEKTQEIEEYYEEEESVIKESPKTKKTFTFKSIVAEKIKSSNSGESSVRKKAGFKTREIEEPEEQIIKPQDIVFEEDEKIAKILEEKIKKSLPRPENKTVSVDEQEITAVEISEPDLIYEEELDEDDFATQEFESLGELIAIKNPQSKLDYLLLTAYYLQTSESLFKYSLKQLNSKAMPFLGSLIDHSIIHNAVAHDFIEVVPDYNGTAEVTEYRLTSLGENYLINEL